MKITSRHIIAYSLLLASLALAYIVDSQFLLAGGGACVIIIEGNGVQGDAAELSSTAVASCQLIDYIGREQELPDDALQPIIDFHKRARQKLQHMNQELDEINKALAARYPS